MTNGPFETIRVRLPVGTVNRDLVEPRNQVMFPRVLKVCKKAQGCIISR